MPVAFIIVPTMTIALLWYLLRVRRLHGYIEPTLAFLLFVAGVAIAAYALAGEWRYG